MALELDGIVVARQIEIVEPRDDAAIDDLDDVGLLQVLRHAVDRAAILGQRWRADPFAIALHHFRQIKVHLITGAVLHQGGSIAVPTLAEHRGNPDRFFLAATNLVRQLLPVRYLHEPKPAEERGETRQKKETEELQTPARVKTFLVH